MQREKYPEKIPFRLTRMLINAMEVSGIEGNFRFTCESVMRVLRENRESVMAVLEAFVHDPLINWRLLQPSNPTTASDAQNAKNRTNSLGHDGTAHTAHARTARAQNTRG
jgi:FKBP12-rapamycin complex-associated protein